MTESDGIEEALSQNIQAALHSAERAGRVLSRAMERIRALREEGDRTAQRDTALDERYDTARAKALDRLRSVDDPVWRDRAEPQEVARVYVVAKTWDQDLPEADRAHKVIRGVVLDRYGHDVDAPSGEQVHLDPQRQEGPEKAPAALEPPDSANARSEPEIPLVPGEQPSPGDSVAQAERGAWDGGPRERGSRERPAERAEDLSAGGFDAELAETHRRARLMHAHPPRDAVVRKAASHRLAGPRGTARARPAEPAIDR